MRWALPLALLLASVGCSSGHRTAGSVVVTATGRIGQLRMDRSTLADIVSFAGRPDVERRGVEYDATPYIALGYACSAKLEDHTFPVLETRGSGRAGPYCKTVFWLNRRTGSLGDFYTSSARYIERHGVRIGMRTARAERLLHKRLISGCEDNIYLGKGTLTVAFEGGVMHTRTLVLNGRRVTAAGHVTGGRVYAFALHGHRSGIGIFDCL